MKQTLISFLLFLLVLPKILVADEILLKNQQVITGKITAQRDDAIKIDTGIGIPITYYKDEILKINNQPIHTETNSIAQNKSIHQKSQLVSIDINRPEELDYLSKNEIISKRLSHINKYPQFVPTNYQPSEEVFGQIVDGKPWWGLRGTLYYGGTPQSIMGNSEESRFILNPYLLVAVQEFGAGRVSDPRLSSFPTFYPQPTKLLYSKNSAEAYYNIKNFYQNAEKYAPFNLGKLFLTLLNAKDLGFPYFAIEKTSLNNINTVYISSTVHHIEQYIHLGGSCGHPEQCNNVSPYHDKYVIEFTQLPASLSFKLWKEEPHSAEAKADFNYSIFLN